MRSYPGIFPKYNPSYEFQNLCSLFWVYILLQLYFKMYFLCQYVSSSPTKEKPHSVRKQFHLNRNNTATCCLTKSHLCSTISGLKDNYSLMSLSNTNNSVLVGLQQHTRIANRNE